MCVFREKTKFYYHSNFRETKTKNSGSKNKEIFHFHVKWMNGQPIAMSISTDIIIIMCLFHRLMPLIWIPKLVINKVAAGTLIHKFDPFHWNARRYLLLNQVELGHSNVCIICGQYNFTSIITTAPFIVIPKTDKYI